MTLLSVQSKKCIGRGGREGRRDECRTEKGKEENRENKMDRLGADRKKESK